MGKKIAQFLQNGFCTHVKAKHYIIVCILMGYTYLATSFADVLLWHMKNDSNLSWYDVMWCDVTWLDMTWHDMAWYKHNSHGMHILLIDFWLIHMARFAFIEHRVFSLLRIPYFKNFVVSFFKHRIARYQFILFDIYQSLIYCCHYKLSNRG